MIKILLIHIKNKLISMYESWKETNEILADKELVKAIKQGEKDVREGNICDFEELKKELFE